MWFILSYVAAREEEVCTVVNCLHNIIMYDIFLVRKLGLGRREFHINDVILTVQVSLGLSFYFQLHVS